MRVIADLHIHSKYSRACGKDISLASLAKYSLLKGVSLMGTGDAQHPKWFDELSRDLVDEHGSGVYSCSGQNFLLTSEISLVYSQDGKGRRIHVVVLFPSLAAVKGVQAELLKKGRLDYDGRPIFGMSCPAFLDLVRSVDEKIEVIPAHAWTPWFGLFGSNSGFDSVKECFQDHTRHIHAIETGLSSDPEMNWRLSSLDGFQLVSFSDSHSHWPWRIGREATVFDLNGLSYDSVLRAVRTGSGLSQTIEFFPEEGKYHVDGHRQCGVFLQPSESRKCNGLCQQCRKPLTIGVLNRVEQLADRPEGFKPAGAKPFVKLVPLSELLAKGIGSPVASKKVWVLYSQLVEMLGSEFGVLLDAPAEKLGSVLSDSCVSLVLSARNQLLRFRPGYDGVYGELLLDKPVSVENSLEKKPVRQSGLEEY